MSQDFDEFPIYDPIVKAGSANLSSIWVNSISTFYQNLIGYLTSNGIFMPQLTTIQRDSLKSPINGQMIYNTTTNEVQVWQVKAGTGAWRAVTTTP